MHHDKAPTVGDAVATIVATCQYLQGHAVASIALRTIGLNTKSEEQNCNGILLFVVDKFEDNFQMPLSFSILGVG